MGTVRLAVASMCKSCIEKSELIPKRWINVNIINNLGIWQHKLPDHNKSPGRGKPSSFHPVKIDTPL
jgi:hypothetical protein